MHKDQNRIQEVLLPDIMDRALGNSPQDERDCTVLGRLLIQGPDPLFLMEACPEDFKALCRGLILLVGDGKEAIEKAHWMGPGTLLGDDGGLPMDTQHSYVGPISWRYEALWLVLASMSDCTEDGYGTSTSMVERVRRQANSIRKFTCFMMAHPSLEDIMWRAQETLQSFFRSTVFTEDPHHQVPMTDDDVGFYLGYKRGHPCVAVKTRTAIFYGTVPTTTLEEQGIRVDKEISPHYGMVFSD